MNTILEEERKVDFNEYMTPIDNFCKNEFMKYYAGRIDVKEVYANCIAAGIECELSDIRACLDWYMDREN